jgi:hypothetical protein
MVTQQHVLRLYRQLLKAGRQFPAYNFREYSIRRTRDAFRESMNEQDPNKIQQLFDRGVKDLEMVQRQVYISSQFKKEPLVIERE